MNPFHYKIHDKDQEHHQPSMSEAMNRMSNSNRRTTTAGTMEQAWFNVTNTTAPLSRDFNNSPKGGFP